MKQIFIAPRIVKNEYQSTVYQVDADLINFFKQLNYSYCSVFTTDTKHLTSMVNSSCALVLGGGGDIAKVNNTVENCKRDSYEKKLIKMFIKQQKPIIAICRGFQLLASLNKGILLKSKTHVCKKHTVNLTTKNSLTKEKKLTTNSFHNWIITKIENFEIYGTANDDSIEIAVNNKKRVLGLMFHPERKNKSQKHIKQMVGKFLNGFNSSSGRTRKEI